MKSYRILQPNVVYEVLTSEVIVVDFTTGNYYALLHVAKQVWQLIEQRATLEQIVQLLATRYQREKESIRVDLHPFIEQLLENRLIELTDDVGMQEPSLSASDGWEYDAPQMQQYTDVQSLLLLDPIHEVAEVGWPVKSDAHGNEP